MILARLLKPVHNKSLLGEFPQVPWYFITRFTRLHQLTGGTSYRYCKISYKVYVTFELSWTRSLYMIYLFQIKYFKIILFSTYEIHEQLYLLRCWNSIHGPLSSFQQAVVNASQGYIVLHEREFPNEYTKNPIGQLYLVAICSFYLNFPAH